MAGLLCVGVVPVGREPAIKTAPTTLRELTGTEERHPNSMMVRRGIKKNVPVQSRQRGSFVVEEAHIGDAGALCEIVR